MFSYVFMQASLIAWTKGFQCEGVEGKNVGKLLEEAITKRGVSLLTTAFTFTLY